jgi:hypothetical protein
MFHSNRLLIAAALSICLLCFAGCGSSSGGGSSQGGGSGTSSANKGTILITAPFPSKAASKSRFIPLNVYIYVVTVCEQGTTTAVVTPASISKPSSGDTVDASITDVPTGWKTVRVFAYDSSRNLLAQGASDVEVKSSDQGSSDVTVTLTSTSDAPSVSSTTPTNAQTSVSINTKVTVLFSMTVLASSVTTDTFYLKSAQGNVSGTVTVDGSTAVFAPSEALQPLTVYTAVVSGNVQNTNGLTMGTDYTWSFTTGEKPDTTPPQVKETSPTSGATNISTTSTVSAVFTKNIDPSTVTSSTFTVKASGASVQGTISTLGNSVSFVPTTALQAGVLYSVTLGGTIKDLAGNAMGTDYTWSFTTASSGGGGGGGGGGGSTGSWHTDIPKPTFQGINAIRMYATRKAVAVGDGGTILTFDGTATGPGWVPRTSGVSENLNAIYWDGTDYYIVGDSGRVLKMSSTWSITDISAGGPTVNLYCVGGNSIEFFVAGAGGTIKRYVIGTGWDTVNNFDAPSDTDLKGIWCNASDAVAVGKWSATDGSSIYHSSKATGWSTPFIKQAAPATVANTTLNAISGSLYTDLHIVGDVNSSSGTATYLHGNNGTYTDYSSTTGTTNNLKSIWYLLGGTLNVAVGDSGTIITNTDTTPPIGPWTTVSSGTNSGLRAVTGSSATDMYAAGASGTALFSGDGTTWVTSVATTQNLNSVWADSSTGKAVAVGDCGAVMFYDTAAWRAMNMGTTYNFIGVWGADMTNVFAMADNSGGPMYKFNGSNWAYVSDAATGLKVYDIWGRSSTEVYVVGFVGAPTNATRVYRWNGGAWAQVGSDIGAAASFSGTGIWGTASGTDLYICGTSSGTDRIYQYSGGVWTAVYNNALFSCVDLWGPSSGNIWCVGWAGEALNGLGTSWGSLSTISAANLKGVWGESSSKFFAVGDSGTIVYYNGSSWTSQSSGVTHDLKGVTGISGSTVFATGTNGTLLRYY